MNNQVSLPQINWAEIKKILLEVLASLKVIENMLPPGTFKNIVGSIIGLLTIVITWIPNT